MKNVWHLLKPAKALSYVPMRNSSNMIVLTKYPIIRSLLWRIARKLYNYARLEGRNSPEANGEYWLLERIVASENVNAPVLMDVGANMGEWSARAASQLMLRNLGGHLHAFEPAAFTFAHLSRRFENNPLVSVNNIALSAETGEVEFFVVGALAGTNSLTSIPGATVEKVTALTLDRYLTERQIDRVLFVKSDTEGHDFSIMLGAADALRQGLVDAWQFEYNHRWIANRWALRDVFEFVSDKPYRIGKLFGNGIEFYEEWHPELDRYFETNYVLVRVGSSIEALGRSFRFDTSNTPVLA